MVEDDYLGDKFDNEKNNNDYFKPVGGSEESNISEEPICTFQITDPKYKLNEFGLSLMFLFVFFGNCMINLDHGSIPAATKSIKKDLDLDNAQLGRLGSTVFGGLVLGSMFAALVYNKWSYKFVLTLSYLGNAIGLLIVS